MLGVADHRPPAALGQGGGPRPPLPRKGAPADSAAAFGAGPPSAPPRVDAHTSWRPLRSGIQRRPGAAGIRLVHLRPGADWRPPRPGTTGRAPPPGNAGERPGESSVLPARPRPWPARKGRVRVPPLPAALTFRLCPRPPPPLLQPPRKRWGPPASRPNPPTGPLGPPPPLRPPPPTHAPPPRTTRRLGRAQARARPLPSLPFPPAEHLPRMRHPSLRAPVWALDQAVSLEGLVRPRRQIYVVTDFSDCIDASSARTVRYWVPGGYLVSWGWGAPPCPERAQIVSY